MNQLSAVITIAICYKDDFLDSTNVYLTILVGIDGGDGDSGIHKHTTIHSNITICKFKLLKAFYFDPY